MLTAHHLTKYFNLQTLFKDVTFSLSPGDRAGLIGPNGGGKTTLLRILAGIEPITSGHVTRDPQLRMGYLPQGFEPDPALSLGEIIARATGSSDLLYAELESVSLSLAAHPDDLALQARYDQLIGQAALADPGRVVDLLAGLGLAGLDPAMPVAHLSGGQKTRLSLALVLLGDPQLLLLDEPTNHLDIAMLEWLEAWLSSNPAAMLIVSHDRAFLDNTVTRILELDPQRGGIHEYPGNYSTYLEQRQAEIDRQWAEFNDQQVEIRRMKADIAAMKTRAYQNERRASSIRIGGPEFKQKGYKDYVQTIAKAVARKAKSRETKLDRYLESDERVDKPQPSWHMKLEFNDTPHLGQTVVRLEDLSIGYDPAAPLLTGLNLTIRAGRRIAFSGPNGSGKTTLLRTLAGQIPPLAGQVHIGQSVRLGYMSQDQSGLEPDRSAVETIMNWFSSETEARTYLSYYLLTGDEPLKPVSLLSYGQRARLMLAVLAANGCNLLLLDEPINHLDIPSRAQFEAALSGFAGAILAVVHDRYFIERFAEEVWWVQAGGVRVDG
jgi:ATP-binding cassette subfamily F protein 3